MPRLPRKTKVDVTKYHVCHAKCKWTPSATPATQKFRGVTRDQGAPSAPPNPGQSYKRHACHAKRRWMSPSATPAMQKCRGVTRDQRGPKRHQTQASPISAMPATKNEGGCHQAPLLPRKVQVDVAKCHACHTKVPRQHPRPRGLNAPPDPGQPHKCHACHAKPRWMSPSATPAAQSASGCRKCRGVTRDQGAPSAPPDPAQSQTCHACHANWGWM